MNDYNTGQSGDTTQEWPQPAVYDPTAYNYVDKDPRKVIARELIDWLAVHVTGVEMSILHQAADSALDVIEDAMSDKNGGDWSTPW